MAVYGQIIVSNFEVRGYLLCVYEYIHCKNNNTHLIKYFKLLKNKARVEQFFNILNIFI